MIGKLIKDIQAIERLNRQSRIILEGIKTRLTILEKENRIETEQKTKLPQKTDIDNLPF